MSLDLTSLDTYVADKLSTTEFVGGLLISLLFLLAVIVSVSFLTKNNSLVTVSGVISIIFCSGIEWLPAWVPILVVMMVAIMYGNFATRLMGGG